MTRPRASGWDFTFPLNSMQYILYIFITLYYSLFFLFIYFIVYLTCAARHGMTYSRSRSRVPPYTRFTRAFKTDYCKHPVRLTYANSVATNSLNERARWIFGCFKPTDRANVKPANFVAAFLLIVCSSCRQNCERKKENRERERERVAKLCVSGDSQASPAESEISYALIYDCSGIRDPWF